MAEQQITFTADTLFQAFLNGLADPRDFVGQQGGVGLLGPAGLKIELYSASGQPLGAASDASALGAGRVSGDLATQIEMIGLLYGPAGVRAVAARTGRRRQDEPLLATEEEQGLIAAAQVARLYLQVEALVAPFGWSSITEPVSSLAYVPVLGPFLVAVQKGIRSRQSRVLIVGGP
jgi:hypothetical protein